MTTFDVIVDQHFRHILLAGQSSYLVQTPFTHWEPV